MKINELKKNISESLFTEIKDAKCCLLDIPNHRNSGDHLIWQGEVDLLSNRIYYSCSLHFFNPKKVMDNSIILLHSIWQFTTNLITVRLQQMDLVFQSPRHNN